MLTTYIGESSSAPNSWPRILQDEHVEEILSNSGCRAIITDDRMIMKTEKTEELFLRTTGQRIQSKVNYLVTFGNFEYVPFRMNIVANNICDIFVNYPFHSKYNWLIQLLVYENKYEASVRLYLYVYALRHHTSKCSTDLLRYINISNT